MWFPSNLQTPPACCLCVCGLFLQPPFEKPGAEERACFLLLQAVSLQGLYHARQDPCASWAEPASGLSPGREPPQASVLEAMPCAIGSPASLPHAPSLGPQNPPGSRAVCGAKAQEAAPSRPATPWADTVWGSQPRTRDSTPSDLLPPGAGPPLQDTPCDRFQ